MPVQVPTKYEIHSPSRTKTIWTPLLGETLEVGRKGDSDHDKYAMAITRREGIVEQDKTRHHKTGDETLLYS